VKGLSYLQLGTLHGEALIADNEHHLICGLSGGRWRLLPFHHPGCTRRRSMGRRQMCAVVGGRRCVCSWWCGVANHGGTGGGV
jgi:hypothetical protein